MGKKGGGGGVDDPKASGGSAGLRDAINRDEALVKEREEAVERLGAEADPELPPEAGEEPSVTLSSGEEVTAASEAGKELVVGWGAWGEPAGRLVKQLPRPLTTEERSQRFEELAGLEKEHARVSGEAKATAFGYREVLKDLDGKIAAACAMTILEAVPCEERVHFAENTRRVIRLDTWETVEGPSALDASARQLALDGFGRKDGPNLVHPGRLPGDTFVDAPDPEKVIPFPKADAIAQATGSGLTGLAELVGVIRQVGENDDDLRARAAVELEGLDEEDDGDEALPLGHRFAVDSEGNVECAECGETSAAHYDPAFTEEPDEDGDGGAS